MPNKLQWNDNIMRGWGRKRRTREINETRKRTKRPILRQYHSINYLFKIKTWILLISINIHCTNNEIRKIRVFGTCLPQYITNHVQYIIIMHKYNTFLVDFAVVQIRRPFVNSLIVKFATTIHRKTRLIIWCNTSFTRIVLCILYICNSQPKGCANE